MALRTSRMDRIKMNMLGKALKKTHGNVRKACKILGISPDTAYRWINSSVELSESLEKLRENGNDSGEMQEPPGADDW